MNEIIERYARGQDVYMIARAVCRSPEYVLKKIGEHRKQQRLGFVDKCKHCRWKPCVGSPVCYKEKFRER